MSKVSRESASEGGDFGPVIAHTEHFDGYTVDFVTFKESVDHTPLLKGLPDDRCQCPHWGYVLKGSITYRYADRDEIIEAGDAYYAPPGHVPVANEPGTECVQFSPAAELKKSMDAIMRNMQALQVG
ncbi:MAG TPA: hypothetical protein VFL73_00360 [Solirubrobacteraceae bacterium]|jgi:hypothetical protein|nr:hypothetical protein [Solirubrobacteraceae bacterium]